MSVIGLDIRWALKAVVKLIEQDCLYKIYCDGCLSKLWWGPLQNVFTERVEVIIEAEKQGWLIEGDKHWCKDCQPVD